MNFDNFVVYGDVMKAIEKLPDEETKARIALAVLRFGSEGIENEDADFIEQMVIALIKPGVNKAKDRYAAAVNNGKKGGRPKDIDDDEVFKMKVGGKTNKQIADYLNVEEKTIERANKRNKENGKDWRIEKKNASKLNKNRQNRQNLNNNININNNINNNSNSNVNSSQNDKSENELIEENEMKEFVQMKNEMVEVESNFADEVINDKPQVKETTKKVTKSAEFGTPFPSNEPIISEKVKKVTESLFNDVYIGKKTVADVYRQQEKYGYTIDMIKDGYEKFRKAKIDNSAEAQNLRNSEDLLEKQIDMFDRGNNVITLKRSDFYRSRKNKRNKRQYDNRFEDFYNSAAYNEMI